MARHFPRRIASSALTLGMLAGAATFTAAPADAATASSSSPSSSSASDSGPAPICWSSPKICVPQTWYVPDSVVSNDDILQLLPTITEANNSTASTQLSQTVTVSGQLTLGLSGSISVSPAALLGSLTSLTPSGQIQVSGSVAVQGTVQVPAGDLGYLKFGIIYEQVTGTAYSRDIFGVVTSATETATVPIGFGYVASIAPITDSGSTTSSTAVVTSK